jgi:exosome complex component RRP46
MEVVVKREMARLRPITCEQRVLSQPDGSATYQQGRTMATAAVYGPVQVRMAKERADRAALDVVFKPKVGTPGCSARAVEGVIRGACEAAVILTAHPRALFTVVVQEIHDDGGLLACCVNAVGAALLDACVPMRFPIGAIACSVMGPSSDKEGQIVVDPDAECSRSSSSIATYVFDGLEHNVLGVSATGKLTNEQYQTCLGVCRQAVRDVIVCSREVCAKRAAVV